VVESALHLTIATELRGRIRAGELPVGGPMPSESELCREFSASRGPVRQALAALRAEGLIGGGQGRRAVVLDTVAAQPFATLLSFSRWAEMIGRTPGQVTQEIGVGRPGPAVAAALNLDAGDDVVALVRLRLLDGEPAMVERTSFVTSVGRALLDVDLDTVSIYAHLAEAGADLHTARHTLDAVAADPRDAALLGVAEGSPLLRERRLAMTSTGEPLEWSDDRYRPDVASVTITNTRSAHAAMVRHLDD